MKIVIQCAGDKKPEAGSFEFRGKPVLFVSRSRVAEREASTKFCYFKPDDVNPDSGKSWREMLVEHNSEGENALRLLAAVDLYLNPTYQAAKRYATETEAELYILSAGWGLVSGNFCLPFYNITFTRNQKIPRYAVRGKKDKFDDFNQIEAAGGDEEIHFFGGNNYRSLFYSCTADLAGRKIVHYLYSVQLRKEKGFEYVPFTPSNPRLKTNWHYECLRRFILSQGMEQ